MGFPCTSKPSASKRDPSSNHYPSFSATGSFARVSARNAETPRRDVIAVIWYGPASRWSRRGLGTGPRGRPEVGPSRGDTVPPSPPNPGHRSPPQGGRPALARANGKKANDSGPSSATPQPTNHPRQARLPEHSGTHGGNARFPSSQNAAPPRERSR